MGAVTSSRCSAFGQVLTLPAAKLSTDSDRVIVGVRPEKLHLHRAGAEVPAGRNAVSGVITDASFFGVSTQYLVATPWGQELIAFEQNMSAGGPSARSATRCTMSWEPSHTFGFDGGDDLNAGIDDDLLEVGPLLGLPTSRPGSPPRRCGGLTDADPRLGKCRGHLPERDSEPGPAHARGQPGERACSRRKRSTPYWLLLPGMAWLAVFFVIPLVSLFSTSLQSPVSDNPDDGFYFNWDFANYTEALSRYGEQFLRSFVYAGHRDRAGPGDRLPAGVLHRLQGRQVQGAAAGAGRRAVLRVVPDPHLRVEDDPGRRGLHRARR